MLTATKYPCSVCKTEIGWDAPSGVCSSDCLNRGQGFSTATLTDAQMRILQWLYDTNRSTVVFEDAHRLPDDFRADAGLAERLCRQIDEIASQRAQAQADHAAWKARRQAYQAMLATLPPHTDSMTVRCPTKNRDGSEIGPDDTRGCGSTNIGWDGSECYDCYECGIFFSPYAADPPHRRERDPETD